MVNKQEGKFITKKKKTGLLVTYVRGRICLNQDDISQYFQNE